MSRSKSNIAVENRGWSKEEREFCINSYYLNNEDPCPVMRAYWIKFREQKGFIKEKMPSADLIMEWVKVHEQHEKAQKTKETEEEKERHSNKLSRTQWGRKTGTNRITRKDSIDAGEQNQAIKWKQRDVKWSGPRPVNEKKPIPVVPVVEERPWFYVYRPRSPSPVLPRKPDPMKKQLLQEKFEGKVLESVDLLDEGGHAARASAFVSLRAELQRHAVDHLLAAHRATLADHVSRALRRGKDGERKAAAAVAPLLALQIGEEGTEQFVREVRLALTATATDPSASLDTRIECCSSLAVLCYLVEDDLTEILEVMRMYETIFSGSYLKDDGSVNVSAAAVKEGTWHAAALDGWALLLPLLSRNHALSLLNNQAPSFSRLGELLEAVSLEVRMAAGRALAIAYETVADDDNSDNALTTHVDVLLPRLTELARDSDRSRAKKDLKIQRATFRDTLKYFEKGEKPSTSAHIGSERAEWSSWSGSAVYAALASALGGALQVWAPRSARLRAALSLPDNPPVIADSEQEEKPEKSKKLQRHLRNRAAKKDRHFTRNLNRDKRSAVLAV